MEMCDRPSLPREEREYLDTLTSQIRCRKARPLVEEELAAHIDDQKEALMAEGMDEGDALRESIRQMGDPVEVGVEMDRIHRPRLDWKFLIFVGILSLAGLLLQYRMTGLMAESGYQALSFSRQLVYTCGGIAVMAAVYFLDYTFIGRYASSLWAALTVILIGTALAAPTVNGSRSYTQLFFYLYVPVFAGLLYRFRNRGISGLAKCLALFILTLFLGIRAFGSLNTPFFCSLAFLIMVTAGILKGWFQVPKKKAVFLLWAGWIALPLLLVCLGGLNAYQMDRLRLLFAPTRRAEYDYVTRSILELLSASRLTGNAGLPAREMLPSMSADYIFTFVISCYGLLAGGALILALLALVVKTLRLSSRLTNQLGMMISLGCGCVFAIETAHYLLANCGFSPLAQTYLPFFSCGLRAALVTYLFSGLLLSVYRYKDIAGEIRAFPSLKIRIWMQPARKEK